MFGKIISEVKELMDTYKKDILDLKDTLVETNKLLVQLNASVLELIIVNTKLATKK
jgi:hypothetical protein